MNSSRSMTIVEDLFVTDAFLIKGRLAQKGQRLSRVLEDSARTFLTIEDATMVALRGTEVIRTPRVQVNRSEIVMAHELVEVSGDHAQKQLAADEKSVRIRAFYSGSVQLEIVGLVAPGAYETSAGNSKDWFVMKQPVLRGLDLKRLDDLSVLESLDYAIVRKERLSYIYDFS